MIVTAAVYRQAQPIMRTAEDHIANLKYIADVTGTHAECWRQAKELTLHPVLEFPKGIYRNLEDL